MRRMVLLLLLAAAGAIPAPAQAADPIEGTWSYRGGLVVVRAESGGFTGIVRRELRFAVCSHPAGERMWRIFKRRGYSGRHLSFDDLIPGCGRGDRVSLAASFQVSGDALRIRIARREGISPGPCGRNTDCFTLRRVSPRVSTTEITIGVDARPVSGAETVGETYQRSSLSALVDVEQAGSKRTIDGSVDLVHDYTLEGSKVVRLDVTAVLASTLRLRVRESEVGGCPEGARGSLLFDDGDLDVVQLRICGWNLVFRRGSGADSRVDVTVRRR